MHEFGRALGISTGWQTTQPRLQNALSSQGSTAIKGYPLFPFLMMKCLARGASLRSPTVLNDTPAQAKSLRCLASTLKQAAISAQNQEFAFRELTVVRGTWFFCLPLPRPNAGFSLHVCCLTEKEVAIFPRQTLSGGKLAILLTQTMLMVRQDVHIAYESMYLALLFQIWSVL